MLLLMVFHLLAIALSGVAPEISMLLLLVDMALIGFFVFAKHAFSKIYAPWVVLFCYILVSLIIFGGGASFGNGAISWLQGEGRGLVYFVPVFLAVFIPLRKKSSSLKSIELAARVCILFLGFVLLVKVFLGFNMASSHHALGAVSAVLVVFSYSFLIHNYSLTRLFYFLLSVGVLMGANSRTTLLACAASILIFHVLKFDFKKAFFPLLIGGAAFPIMVALFPIESQRLVGAFNLETMAAVGHNFDYAFHSRPPAESSDAWELHDENQYGGNLNVAIRGYLWGRALNEFLLSPIFGTGFGSYNDTGRELAYLIPGVACFCEASGKNENIHTAHNSYFHFLAEIGFLGLALFLMPLIRMMKDSLYLIYMNESSGDGVWASRVVFLLVTMIMLIAFMQHAFGAPLFSFTILFPAILIFRWAAVGKTNE